MEILVKGKQMDVGESLRVHAEDNLNANVKKYFDRAMDATVIFSREAHLYRADISVHVGRDILMQGSAKADEVYAAFDNALSRIAKQLRRYKRRLRNHKPRNAEELWSAQYSILAAEPHGEVEPEEAPPIIVAEMAHEIATLTVSEAVMRMDLADQPVMMFRNRAHGNLNLVYRRNDGNIGWIDPSGGK